LIKRNTEEKSKVFCGLLEKSILFCYNIFVQKRDFHKKGQDGKGNGKVARRQDGKKELPFCRFSLLPHKERK